MKIAASGGKVIHPEAIKWAKKSNIPIKIKKLSSSQGTVIAGTITNRSLPLR
ncbi:hypothetical protein PD280_22415 [Virgibacillus salarius]|uniref:hypothetical protein n=1 Tax=Virgibacillus salarius TaxID=447199 RepID=UPI002493345A|nr:hypothetical protein [Virgibacillus salarius]WBX80291.1 hypothetical protein PD280_22415 [Virgibacillus salarius]